jgi:threonine/homoserine/homoserine lactone efflux protein
MKKIFLKVIIFAAITVIIFSPYLLAVDFVKYSPVVLIIWILSIAYYLWMKRRAGRQSLSESEAEEEPEKKMFHVKHLDTGNSHFDQFRGNHGE